MSLIVNKLKKAYGSNVLWTDLSFEFAQGSIVTIQGRSGEGKTTFLRCLNGLESLDGGSVTIDGVPLFLEEDEKKEMISVENRKKIGMVFQDFNLFPHLNVMDNLTLAPLYHKEPKEVVRERALSLLRDFDIEEYSEAYVHQLSGGQRQRVAIARACMLNPKVLCFDEPTSALDELTRDQIESVIRRLAQRGITLVIVTHDTAFSNQIADVILKIEGGVFQQER